LFRSVFANSLRMSNEARVFFDAGPDALIRNPAVPPAAMGELRWLKEDYSKRPAGAGWFYDDFYLCEHPMDQKRVWQFDDKTRSVAEITPRLASITTTFCAGTRREAPLSTEFHHRGDTLFWQFGPYRDGA